MGTRFHDETVRKVTARSWTNLKAQSRVIISSLVGGRDAEYALAFMDDLPGGLVAHGRGASKATRGHESREVEK
jgi:hypothetical protein